MNATRNSQQEQSKSPRPHKSGRHDARKFIAPTKAAMREAFRNTNDSERVALHYEATVRSVGDVVMAGHDATIQDHGARLAAIEARLGMRKPMGSERGLQLVRRTA